GKRPAASKPCCAHTRDLRPRPMATPAAIWITSVWPIVLSWSTHPGALAAKQPRWVSLAPAGSDGALGGALAVPILPAPRHVENAFLLTQGIDRHLARIRIDAHLIRIALADHEIPAGGGSAVHEGVPHLVPRGETDVVTGFHLVSLITQEKRHFSFKDQRVFFFQQVIVIGAQAHTRRRCFDPYAHVVIVPA